MSPKPVNHCWLQTFISVSCLGFLLCLACYPHTPQPLPPSALNWNADCFPDSDQHTLREWQVWELTIWHHTLTLAGNSPIPVGLRDAVLGQGSRLSTTFLSEKRKEIKQLWYHFHWTSAPYRMLTCCWLTLGNPVVNKLTERHCVLELRDINCADSPSLISHYMEMHISLDDPLCLGLKITASQTLTPNDGAKSVKPSMFFKRE